MPTGTTRCEFTRQGNLGWKGRERLVSSLQRMLVLKTPFLKGRGLPGEEEPFGGKAGTLRQKAKTPWCFLLGSDPSLPCGMLME